MKLVEPDKINESEFCDFIDQLKEVDEELIPCTLDQKDLSFHDYIKQLNDQAKGRGLPEGWVPASSFFLLDDKNKIYGAINIRHRLTEILETLGGHIGYSIRPTERKKGYGSLILNLGLQEAIKLGLKKVLVTCNINNIASAKVIQNNGGKFDSISKVDDKTMNRYWIKL